MRDLLSNVAAKICAIVLFTVAVGAGFFAFIGMDAVYDNNYNGITYAEGDMLYSLYQTVSSHEGLLVPLFIICIIVVLSTLVFLLCASGHRKGVEGITPNFLDKIPFDLYLVVDIALFVLCVLLFSDIFFTSNIFIPLCVVLFAVMGLLILAFFMTCSTRFKIGKWWRNSIIYMWIAKPIGKLFAWLWRQICLIFNNLALLWKGILIYFAFILLSIIFFFNSISGSGLASLLLVLLGIASFLFVCTLMLQMNTLKQGVAKMAAGDLDYRVDTKNMYHDLKQHGSDLNRISEGMALAVEERMKSEHFKTELITNVSHDLKTPLTSIINYVDLLQKEAIDNPKAQEYLEVLARQSARLKKLTEDLVEASKASTGNIQMELTNTDMTEFINQIMGEYQERFKTVHLESVVNVPEERVYILADGRSLWRVFDNLLNNICKYSQPNTRVFIEMTALKDQVVISLKNTSRDLLNIPAEDLLERFVRADSSRNSEGSGLGLSIARSLTELQKGTLELSVDGDLFKVIITFARIDN